jgi:hypothetical protein
VSCRPDRDGLVTRPGGIAGPALPACAGSRFRPLAVDYLRLWRTGPPGHAEALTAQWRAFAHRSNLALAHASTEHPDVPPREWTAFRALVKALHRPHIHTVIIPAPEHFSRVGDMHRAMRTFINVETGADLLIVSEHGRGAS